MAKKKKREKAKSRIVKKGTSPVNTQETRKIGVDVPVEHHTALKIKAAEKGKSMSQLIREYIEKILSKD